MGFGETQRNTAYRFQMSQPSVCRIFHNVLSYMSQLHKAFVQMPTDDYISDKISTEFRGSFFIGDVGFGGIRRGIVSPYTQVRYHLQEYSQRKFLIVAILTRDASPMEPSASARTSKRPSKVTAAKTL
ncbi:hypothetical protein E4U46_004379 [Claviceps purpurea]|nr:hypothetical protein E4U46_004379 [Claviceps purpurea]